MDWKEPTETLEPGVSVRSNKPHPNNWPNIRKAVLAKNDNRCNFCGGKYTRYLICIELVTDKYGTCCKLCYMVKHLDIGSTDKIILGYSDMSQVDIIRKTVDNMCPVITMIDPNVKLLKLSPLEYSSLIRHKRVLPKQYKIFFKNVELEASKELEFSDDDSILSDCDNDDKKPVVYHHFSLEELAVLRDHFQ